MGVYKKIDFPEMIFKPYKYQEKAIEAMIRAKRGILKANCGSGKSICAINIIKKQCCLHCFLFKPNIISILYFYIDFFFSMFV